MPIGAQRGGRRSTRYIFGDVVSSGRPPDTNAAADLSSDALVGRTTGASSRAWAAVAVVGVAVFAVTTTEMMPIGLLPGIAGSLGISEGRAGLSVSLYGLLAGVSAPPLALITARADRRTVLLWILLTFSLGNAAAALAPSFATLMAARLATGLAHGLLWALIATVAVRLVTAREGIRSTTWVFTGISAALVLGVPLGAAIEALASWRLAFWLLAILNVLSLALVLLLVPRLPAIASNDRATYASLLRSPSLRWAVAITAIVVVGNYAAYTYVAPFIHEARGIGLTYVAPLLLAYGVAGVAGNALAGSYLARASAPLHVLRALAAASTVALLLLIATSSTPVLVVLLVIWGAAYSGMPVALQTLVLDGSRTGELATSVYVMVFNCSIAAGAFVGGVAIDRASATAPLIVGLVLAAISTGVAAFAGRRRT